MVGNVLLNQGDARGRNPFGDVGLAGATLEDKIGAPEDGFPRLGALEILFAQAAAFHAVQVGHFAKDLGPRFDELLDLVVHGATLCTCVHKSRNQKIKLEPKREFLSTGNFLVLHPSIG